MSWIFRATQHWSKIWSKNFRSICFVNQELHNRSSGALQELGRKTVDQKKIVDEVQKWFSWPCCSACIHKTAARCVPAHSFTVTLSFFLKYLILLHKHVNALSWTCMHIHFVHCNISFDPTAFEISSHTATVWRSLCSRLAGPSTMEMPGMNWASGARNGPRGHFLPLGTGSLSPPIFKTPLENNNVCSSWKRTFVTFEFTATINYLADALNKRDGECNSCTKLLTELRNITAAKWNFFKMTSCWKNKERHN